MTRAPTETRDLLGLDGLSRSSIVDVLTAARSYDDGTGKPRDDGALRETLRGRSVCNLFFEDSTRTRVSFSLAAGRLGAGVINLTAPGSSVTKGETVLDTASVVEATGGDALVVRAASAGVPMQIAARVGVPVINAGDGAHEHPTQGLLDIYALASELGGERLASFDLSGLRVAIVGDIASSRVARSDIAGMTALGAEVVCVGPPALAPASLTALGCAIETDLDAVLPAVDAVQMLRVQFERHGGGSSTSAGLSSRTLPGVGSPREYRALYALTEARAKRMKPGSLVMHPGPINRGFEMDGSVADGLAGGLAGGNGSGTPGGPRSIVLRQVASGLLVRMAVLARAMEA
ncbi:MAG: aspartate carbamoyltransferase catalytic subunit [Planctomycetota bacterium]